MRAILCLIAAAILTLMRAGALGAVVSGEVASRDNVQSTTGLPSVRTLQVSGVLTDGAGGALTGTQGVTFALYAEQSGGAPLWLETQTVTADDKGSYSVLLGSMRSDGLPQDLFTSNQALT